MLMEYRPSRTLRSGDSGQILEPRVQYKHSEAAFTCYVANKWNKLQTEVKSVPSVHVFKSRLNTLLFSYAYNSVLLFILYFIVIFLSFFPSAFRLRRLFFVVVFFKLLIM